MKTELIVEDRPCPICGTSKLEEWRRGNFNYSDISSEIFSCTNLAHGRHFPIKVCTNCKFKFCVPCPSKEYIEELYSGVVDDTYLKYESAREIAANETLKRLGKRSGKLLEVGCYTGVFLKEAQKYGFECYGIEPSMAAVELCKTRGLNVAYGFVDREHPWNQKYDTIVMWDVIEHLYNPLSALKAIKALLTPEGEIHFTTVRIDCLFARLLGSAWPWYMPMHISFFEKSSLENLCRQAGFKDVEISRNFHYSDTGYLSSKLNAMFFPFKLAGMALALLPRTAVRISLGDTVYVRAVAP